MKLIVPLAAILATTILPEPLGADEKERPNFVFILTDDQGWSETSVRMHPDVDTSFCSYLVTPNIKRLAREGMRFTSGYAPAPICTPTRRSVLCGMSPARQRGTEFKSDFDPARHLTIPKALKAVDANYRCAHFGKWGERMVANPEQCGYDESDGETGNRTGGGRADASGTSVATKDDPKLTFSVTRRANDFMERQVDDGNPFYLQVSYYAAHRQIQTQTATHKKYQAKGQPPRTFPTDWAAMVEDLDTGIGRLLDKIDELGIAGETYVVLSADNGGAEYVSGNPNYVKRLDVQTRRGRKRRRGKPAETGRDEQIAFPANFPLRGAKQWLYEGGIRVPFIVRGPGIKAGSFCHEPVIQYDLLPTFVDLAGGAVSSLPEVIDGGSLRTLLEEGQGSVERPLRGIVFHRPDNKRRPGYSALRAGDYKLVVTWETRGDAIRQELFNLADDPGEQNDLSGALQEKTWELYGILTRYLKKVNAEMPPGVEF